MLNTTEPLSWVRIPKRHNLFLRRGNIHIHIEDSIQKIQSLKRKDLLKTYETSKDEENNKIPYVTTFNPHNPEIFPEILKNKSLLLRNDRMKSIYANKTILKSKRQPPNLKKLLTKAKFTNHQKSHLKSQNARNRDADCANT